MTGFTIRCSGCTYITLEYDGKFIFCLDNDSMYAEEMLYARMLCGQYNQDKLEAFKDLIESSDDRFVVFYNFTSELEELEAIANELNRPFSLVTGACKRLDEYEQFSKCMGTWCLWLD